MLGLKIKKNIVAEYNLKKTVENLEALQEFKEQAAKELKEGFEKAEHEGFNSKAIRLVLKRRKMDREERKEQDALLDSYKSALGML